MAPELAYGCWSPCEKQLVTQSQIQYLYLLISCLDFSSPQETHHQAIVSQFCCVSALDAREV